MILFPVLCGVLAGSILICFASIFAAERWRGARRSALFVIDEESSVVFNGTYMDQFIAVPVGKAEAVRKIHTA
jgi:hypothetical protein